MSIPGCHDDIFEAFRASSQGASLLLVFFGTTDPERLVWRYSGCSADAALW